METVGEIVLESEGRRSAAAEFLKQNARKGKGVAFVKLLFLGWYKYSVSRSGEGCLSRHTYQPVPLLPSRWKVEAPLALFKRAGSSPESRSEVYFPLNVRGSQHRAAVSVLHGA